MERQQLSIDISDLYKINYDGGTNQMKTYEVSQTQEFSVDLNECNFLIIYGHHINGWFIAIPNWNVCTEAGAPASISYNSAKLAEALDIENKNVCVQLAQAVKEHWEGLEKSKDTEQEQQPEIEQDIFWRGRKHR